MQVLQQILIVLNILLCPATKHGRMAARAYEDQVLKYDVIRNDKVIGHMESVRKVRGSNTEYHTESSVQVNLIVQLAIYTRVTGHYQNGMLVSGTALRKVNNSTRVNTRISFQKDRYLIEDEDHHSELKERISYTTACLMHIEPAGQHRIFSEAYRKFIPVREMRPHHYELQLPDGNRNYYTYANGICIGAEVNTNLSKAFFRLKK